MEYNVSIIIFTFSSLHDTHNYISFTGKEVVYKFYEAGNLIKTITFSFVEYSHGKFHTLVVITGMKSFEQNT